MMEGRVTKVLVHATFPCERCGDPADVFTTCRVRGRLIVEPADKPEGEIRCAVCRQRQEDRRRAIEKLRRQKEKVKLKLVGQSEVT